MGVKLFYVLDLSAAKKVVLPKIVARDEKGMQLFLRGITSQCALKYSLDLINREKGQEVNRKINILMPILSCRGMTARKILAGKISWISIHK